MFPVFRFVHQIQIGMRHVRGSSGTVPPWLLSMLWLLSAGWFPGAATQARDRAVTFADQGSAYDPVKVGLAADRTKFDFTLHTTGCDDRASGDSDCGPRIRHAARRGREASAAGISEDVISGFISFFERPEDVGAR